MINRIIMVLIIAGGVWYLFQKKSKPPPPPAPPPPPILAENPPPVLSEAELHRIRQATMDADPQVRWAAVELLYRVKDPLAFQILEKTLRIDTEPNVRKNALNILKDIDRDEVPEDLIKALLDTEKDIRISALLALGEVGNPQTTLDVVKALRDVDPEVRMQALHAIGRIQTKVESDHLERQAKAKQEWEEAVRRAHEEHGTPLPAEMGGAVDGKGQPLKKKSLVDLTRKAMKGE